jgi:hypothetical protein
MQPELIEAAVRLPQPAGASPVWVHIYVAGCALMAIGCLHHAIKMGILEYESCEADDSRVWKLSAASTQVTILLFFGAAYCRAGG